MMIPYVFRNPRLLFKREVLLIHSNLSRILYDCAIFGAAAIVANIFSFMYAGRFNPIFFTAPFFGLVSNLLVGVYGRHRVASGKIKSAILASSCLLVGLLLAALSGDVLGSALWASFSVLPLILPRLFLSLHRRTSSGHMSQTLSKAMRGSGPVLVVGGGGYIGSHVVHQLLAEGFSVRVLDSLFYGKDTLGEFLTHPKFELLEGDVTDIRKLVQATDGAYAVVHLAGLVGDPACALDENYTLHSNVVVTKMLKEVAVSAGVQRFIFASSCSVYGANDDVVDETSELNPVSLYARTKIASEKELLASVSDEFFVTILRFATVFGHSRRPRFDLVGNLFTAQAFNDGRVTVYGADQWRPFIHVADIARAIVMTLKANPFSVQGQVLNVGDANLNMTIGQLAEKVKEVVGRDRTVDVVCHDNAADRRNYRVSFDKIRALIGFSAMYQIEDGVKEMVSEFKKGTYSDYKSAKFSNMEVTKRVVVDFKDPKNTENLYRPYNLADVVGG